MEEKKYEVIVKKKTSKLIRKFPKEIRERVDEAIEALADDPRPKGRREIKPGTWRIRIGRRYRVIYKIDDEKRTVTVTKAATREGAY